MAKVMVVEVIVPDTFGEQDVCIAMNIGIRQHAAEQEGRLGKLSAIDYNTHVLSKYSLK